MPVETVQYLAFVLSALAIFAAALTYADWATRHANVAARNAEPVGHEKPSHRNNADTERKAA